MAPEGETVLTPEQAKALGAALNHLHAEGYREACDHLEAAFKGIPEVEPHVCQPTPEQERAVRALAPWKVTNVLLSDDIGRLEAAFFLPPIVCVNCGKGEPCEPECPAATTDFSEAHVGEKYRQAGIREVIDFLQDGGWSLPVQLAKTQFFPPKPQTREERMEALLREIDAAIAGDGYGRLRDRIREVLGGGE